MATANDLSAILPELWHGEALGGHGAEAFGNHLLQVGQGQVEDCG